LTRLNADGWRALRLLAAEKDTTLNALAVEAFNDLLRKHGKRATVENPLLPDQD
jgi:Antitoxin-like ribbon-helix-helix